MSAVEDDIYANLSDAEREAILLNDDGTDPEPEEVVEEPSEPGEEATEEVAEVEETTEEVEAVADPEPESVEVERPQEVAFAPQIEAKGVENYQEVITNLDAEYDTKVDALAARYESGEVTFAEYRKEERTLTRQYESIRQQLNDAQLKADIAAEHNRQSAAQKWELEQNLFYSDRPENAAYKTDPILRGALSAQLEILYADEANAGKSGIWFLREAGKMLDERFGRAAAVSSPTKDAEAKLKKAEDLMAKRKAAHPNIPKTLANVPSAEANEDGGDEFAWLDKLKGMDYERALSKLSENERERYMAA